MVAIDRILLAAVISPVMMFIVLFWGLLEGQLLTVKRYELTGNGDLEEPVRIVFVSDTHAGVFGKPGRLERVGRRVSRLEPDVLLLGGDYVLAYRGDTARLFPPLMGDVPAERVFAVSGNHDHMEGIREIRRGFRNAGIRELDSDAVRMALGGGSFTFAGTSDWEYTRRHPENVLDVLSDESYTVLVTHNPDAVLTVRDHAVPDLALAGHTHGGQITFFGLFAFYLNTYAGEELRTGLNGKGAYPVIVSNGVGLSGFPLRFFAPPQIVCIDIVPPK